MLAKTLNGKKNEQEQMLNECQEVILSSKKKINDLSNERESLMQQLSDLRVKYQIDVK